MAVKFRTNWIDGALAQFLGKVMSGVFLTFLSYIQFSSDRHAISGEND